MHTLAFRGSTIVKLWLGIPHGKVSWDSMETLAFQGSTIVMLWLGVPPWQSILGFHGYSGILGIYHSQAMARGTPMAKYPGIP